MTDTTHTARVTASNGDPVLLIEPTNGTAATIEPLDTTTDLIDAITRSGWTILNPENPTAWDELALAWNIDPHQDTDEPLF